MQGQDPLASLHDNGLGSLGALATLAEGVNPSRITTQQQVASGPSTILHPPSLPSSIYRHSSSSASSSSTRFIGRTPPSLAGPNSNPTAPSNYNFSIASASSSFSSGSSSSSSSYLTSSASSSSYVSPALLRPAPHSRPAPPALNNLAVGSTSLSSTTVGSTATNSAASHSAASSSSSDLFVVDGSAPPRNVLQPIIQPNSRASSSSNSSNQITPPPTKPKKSQKNSIILSGLKHHVPGFVVGCALPTMFGNYPPGLLKNLREIKVVHSTIPFEMKNPRSDLWFVNELIKKTFKQPNGFYATSGQKKFTPLPKQIPPALFYQALQLEDDTQALHDLAAIGNYCSFIGKEGMEQLLVDCKDRYETPRVSCKWKALQTSAKGAAIAATQGASSQAVGTFDSKKRKEEFIVQSQSYSTVQATKKRRSGDDPATTHRQFFDRHAKHAARSLQKTARTLLQRTDRSQVEVTYGGFAETLTVQHNKIPKVSNLGGNWKKGEFTEYIQIQARNQSALEGLIDALKNITFGDNNKHNTNEYVQVHTWYADDKRSLPYEVEEARRSRDPRKKQRTESLGSESQNTATTDGSTIVMPSLCDEEEDEMDVDDDYCMWF